MEFLVNTSLLILKIAYKSVLGSHLQIGAQLCGQENCVNENNISQLELPPFPLIIKGEVGGYGGRTFQKLSHLGR